MQELTALQLKFEFLRDEVISNESLFSATGEVQCLTDKLTNIEEYLNQIVGEYEKCFESYPNQYFISEVSYLSLDKLDNLKEFICKYAEATRFKDQFKGAANKVSKVLLNILTS